MLRPLFILFLLTFVSLGGCARNVQTSCCNDAATVFANQEDFFKRVADVFPKGSSEKDLMAALGTYGYHDTNSNDPPCQDIHEFATNWRIVEGAADSDRDLVCWRADASGKITWISSFHEAVVTESSPASMRPVTKP